MMLGGPAKLCQCLQDFIKLEFISDKKKEFLCLLRVNAPIFLQGTQLVNYSESKRESNSEMKLLIILCLFGLSSGETETCHNHMIDCCRLGASSDGESCNSRTGEIDGVEFDLQSFVNKHIAHSFQYLLMSSHFNNYEKNREGFKKLFRALSDESWENAIGLIKYITKRGGRMDFESFRQDDKLGLKARDSSEQYELYELESLAKALDIQKSFANEANKIHLMASRDSEIMSHIENTFVHLFSSRIRELSGHANDLKNLIASHKHNSLHVYLFDNYLQKLY